MVKFKDPKKIVFVIIVLLTVIIIIAQYVLIPKQQKEDMNIQATNQEFITQDISNTFRYKNTSCSNIGNVIGAFQTLPLGTLDKEFLNSIDSGYYAVKFHGKSESQQDLKASLIYTSVAMFTIVDDLQNIEYIYEDIAYEFSRDKTLSEFGTTEVLLKTKNWESLVRTPLKDMSKTNPIFDRIAKQTDNRT